MTRTITIAAACVLAGGLACAGPSHARKQAGASRSLAAELIARGQWMAAFDLVQPMCLQDPDDAEALMLRGIIYTEQKLLDEAEADLRHAVRLAPKLARAHSALAMVYDVKGKHEEAVTEHRRAVDLERNHPGYLNNLAFALFASGKARDAIPLFHEALRAAPRDAKVRNNLGFAYAATGDFRRAADQFELGGEPWEAKNNLGWAYERRGALAQAYSLYGEALRLRPESVVARQNYSRVAAALGHGAGDAPVEDQVAGSSLPQ